MGSGVVQAFAQAGMQVIVKSRSQASLDKAVARISKGLAKLVEKGKLDLDSQTLSNNFEYIYTIKEIKAPIGYNQISEELSVKISGINIEWETGEDIAPETLAMFGSSVALSISDKPPATIEFC